MNKPKIALSAIFDHSGGYAELARNLSEVLNDLEALAKLDTRGTGIIQPMPTSAFCSEKFMILREKFTSAKSFYGAPNMVMQFVPPFMMLPVQDMPSVGVTMFETRVPEAWHEPLKNVSHLMLHDAFQQELFANAGPKQLAWEPWVSDPIPYSQLPEVVPGNKFLLTVGVARVHKNQSKLIEAFKILRKTYPDFYLVIKAITEDSEYDDYRNKLDDDHILVIPGPYSTQAMDALYHSCFGYVSAAMCEGLDMPAIKAAKCGKPVLLSRHTGHTNWVPEGVRALLTEKVDMSKIPNIHPRYREENMFGYDAVMDCLVDNLRYMVENPWSFKIDISKRFTYRACRESVEKNLAVFSEML